MSKNTNKKLDKKNPMLVEIYHNDKLIGKVTPEEFKAKSGRPTAFLDALIEYWNKFNAKDEMRAKVVLNLK